MILNKIDHSNMPSKEEREKQLKQLLDAAKKSGSKVFDPGSKRDSTMVGSNGLENTDIVIPDLFTFSAYPNVAVSITNKANGPIYYWYTYNGTQQWYYKYTINRATTTWNWLWADWYTHHCLIIEIPVDDESGDSLFYVPAVVKYDNDMFIQATTPSITLFWARGKCNHPPAFSEKVWNVLYSEWWPDIRTLDLGFNFHISLECKNKTVQFRDVP